VRTAHPTLENILNLLALHLTSMDGGNATGLGQIGVRVELNKLNNVTLTLIISIAYTGLQRNSISP